MRKQIKITFFVILVISLISCNKKDDLLLNFKIGKSFIDKINYL
jgi:hypothetical protein